MRDRLWRSTPTRFVGAHRDEPQRSESKKEPQRRRGSRIAAPSAGLSRGNIPDRSRGQSLEPVVASIVFVSNHRPIAAKDCARTLSATYRGQFMLVEGAKL